MSRAAARSSASRSPADGSGAGPVVWAIGAAMLLLLAAILAWWLGWLSFGTDPRVVEIQQLQEEAQKQFTANGGPSTITAPLSLPSGPVIGSTFAASAEKNSHPA